MSQLTSFKSISSLSIAVSEEARSILPYMALEGSTGAEWRRLL